MKPFLFAAFCAGLMLVSVFAERAVAELPIVDDWRFVLRKPADGWQQSSFDDTEWTAAGGGFGTADTPGARIGTNWSTNQIWLRKSIDVDAVPAKPALLVHHDEDAEVYLNGRRVAALEKWSTDYQVVPLDDAAKAAIQVGKNVMAVHCRQQSGGQFIDVHLVDAENVPELPPAKRNTTPFQSDLITTWGSEVTPASAWSEYPRPQLARTAWQNLNGHWDYAITPAKQISAPEQWGGKILVPFALESKLGGVQRMLEADEALWYHRTFDVQAKTGERTLVNFEAVDYQCEVFVNGTLVGKHQGGNTPFSFDVTEAVISGRNELMVRVEDDTEAWQLRGKQTLNPRGIWYTQVSGIWQTVWLETVPTAFVEDLKISTDAKSGTIGVSATIDGALPGGQIQVIAKDGDSVVGDITQAGTEASLVITNAKLWSPDSPHLYDLEIKIMSADGKVIDQVTSYAGIRTVGKTRDQAGHLRFTLNDKVIFHWGPLDQGWWPDGLLTPPSDAALKFDVQWLKSAGFNMIRKHIKVEPRRFYYHCDRIGMMVWQDQVSAGHNPDWTRMKPAPQDAAWPDQYHDQFMAELERMIDLLENHPSIVVWVPFNEAWGQHRTLDVGKWTVARDPSRLVNIASGGNFWPIGDVADEHAYPNPAFPFDPDRYHDFVKVVGEFGGHGYPVEGHLWDANRQNWGYGGLPKNEDEYRERYVTSLKMLDDLRHDGIAAGVYTQTTDVEGEINGLMTYDRKVIKIPAEKLAKLHEALFKP